MFLDAGEGKASDYYDDRYFNWQKSIGRFGGWASSNHFAQSVAKDDVVIDFGCGGGYLLNNLKCRRRIGIEPNPSAAQTLAQFGVEHFRSPLEARQALGEQFADVIVSDNALEHTLDPLQELKNLKPLLKTGGVIHFVVPCDSIYKKYNPADINHHLFSWSPQNLGNIFKEAGYSVEFARAYIHKWPPFYRHVAKLGWPIFNAASRVYGHLERSWFQVEAKARKLAD
jgi:SAM-dependent methyltransferase